MTPDSPPKRSGSTGTPQSPEGDNPFAGIAPDVLAKASVKSSAFAYYLDAMLTSSMVDPDDPTALAAAFERDAPTAEKEVDAWFATIDPSTIPTADIIVRHECEQEHGCPVKTQCFNSGSWSSAAKYECAVVDCGSSKCTLCPDWFPPMLKSLAFKSWCSYLCATRLPPRVLVAKGAIGIVTATGKPFPSAGAWCFEP